MNNSDSNTLFKARFGKNSVYNLFFMVMLFLIVFALILVIVSENPYAIIGLIFFTFGGWVFLRNSFKERYIEVLSDKISIPLLSSKDELSIYSFSEISDLKLITNGVPSIVLEINNDKKVFISLIHMEENDFYSLFFKLKEKVPSKAEEILKKTTPINQVTYLVLVLIFFISPIVLMYLASLKDIQNSIQVFKVFVFAALPIFGGIVHQKILTNLSSDLNGHFSDLIKPEVTKKRNLYGKFIVAFFYIFLVGAIVIMKQIKGVEIPNSSALIGFLCALIFTSLFQFGFRHNLKYVYANEFLVYSITLLLFGFLFFTQLYTFLILKFPQLAL